MPIIEDIVKEDGYVSIKDNRRVVRICQEGVGYIIYFLKIMKNIEVRHRYEKILPRVRSYELKYFIKIAIDNHHIADELIKKLK